MPRASVDSQIGPSTVVGVAARCRVGRADRRRPSEVSATIGWRAPYSAGRISSVMPASMTTWRPPRSRTWRTRRHQPAGPRHEGPAGLDRQPARTAVPGDAVEQRRQLAGEALGPGAGSPERQHRESAADVERVEARSSPRNSADHGQPAADRVAPGIDRAELRPDMEVDRRAAGSRRRRSSTATRPGRSASVSVMPELGAARRRRARRSSPA